MEISVFRDEVGKALAHREELSFECCVSREPDEHDLEIYDIDNEWSYCFSGPSWVAILAALRASIANGDLDDPHVKYPEYYD